MIAKVDGGDCLLVLRPVLPAAAADVAAPTNLVMKALERLLLLVATVQQAR